MLLLDAFDLRIDWPDLWEPPIVIILSERISKGELKGIEPSGRRG
jgi:hypothetical protein